MHAQSLSCVQLFVTHADHSPVGSFVYGIFQARIPEQVAISSSKYLPDRGIKPMSPASPALAGEFFTTEPPGKPNLKYIVMLKVIDSGW